MLLRLATMGCGSATEAGYHGACWCYRDWLPWGVLVLLRLATTGCAGATEDWLPWDVLVLLRLATMEYAGVTKTGYHGVCWCY